jgi:hypothetical protein
MDPFYLTAVILVFVGSVLIVPLFTCSRRASAELNLNLIGKSAALER